MCISVPALVIELEGETASVQIGGVRLRVNTALLEDVSLGDYLLIHAGFAIEKLSSHDAEEIIAIINEIDRHGQL